MSALDADPVIELPPEASDATRLRRARSFVERGWCRGASARDAAGRTVDPSSDHAVAWCAWGALVAAGVPRRDVLHPAMLLLTAATGVGQITPFNDQQMTVAPIIAAFDRAIAAAESR